MKTEDEAYRYSKLYPEVFAKNNGNVRSIRDDKLVKKKLQVSNSLHFFGYCLIDHSGKQFACMHEQCGEFCSCINNELPVENHDFHVLHFHPQDRMLWCEDVLPDIQQFIDSIPEEELTEYRFSFNHRYIHKDGNVSQFLHEGTLAYSEDEGHPVLNLNVFTEIGDIKSDETIVLTLFRYSPEDGYKKVFTKVYGETLNGQLSHREKEIIKLCLQGLSSKMIADKLNLSIHTVKNHKRHSMEKTLTHNIAELINLCIRSRWL
jgi:DNA-binding CsgD family transcriptional regulator